eukprot:353547-Chlamydomonas_euryale.AAC.8
MPTSVCCCVRSVTRQRSVPKAGLTDGQHAVAVLSGTHVMALDAFDNAHGDEADRAAEDHEDVAVGLDHLLDDLRASRKRRSGNGVAMRCGGCCRGPSCEGLRSQQQPKQQPQRQQLRRSGTAPTSQPVLPRLQNPPRSHACATRPTLARLAASLPNMAATLRGAGPLSLSEIEPPTGRSSEPARRLPLAGPCCRPGLISSGHGR